MDRSSLAVVIPCHNEAATLGAVVLGAVRHGQVIVVDDRSTDASRAVALANGADVIDATAPGYGGAIETGLRRTWELGFAFVVTLDADGEHDPAVLADFSAAFDQGAALVCGWRPRPQRTAEYLVDAIGAIRFQIHDLLCGMKGYSRPVLQLYFDSGLPPAVNMTPAILWRRSGGVVAEVAVTGQPRMDQPRFGRALRANWTILRTFFKALGQTRRWATAQRKGEQPVKILTIIQARMTSTRLPGKVLRPILGEPMMGRQIERLRRSQRLGQLVVAASVDATDDVVADYSATIQCPVHRGPLHDVLGRYAGTLSAFGPADHVVRLTADCPLADWRVIDDCIALHLESGADYTSNTVDRWYPRGLDVEVFRAELLHQIAAETADPYDREHVTPFFYRNPDRFRIKQLIGLDYLAHVRWTVDRPDDFVFVASVYEALYPAKPAFTTEDILGLDGALRYDADDPLLNAAPTARYR